MVNFSFLCQEECDIDFNDYLLLSFDSTWCNLYTLSLSKSESCPISLIISVALFWAGSSESRLEGKNHLPWPAGHDPFDIVPCSVCYFWSSFVKLWVCMPLSDHCRFAYSHGVSRASPPYPIISSCFPVSLFAGFSCGFKPIFFRIESLQWGYKYFYRNNFFLLLTEKSSYTIWLYKHAQK